MEWSSLFSTLGIVLIVAYAIGQIWRKEIEDYFSSRDDSPDGGSDDEQP